MSNTQRIVIQHSGKGWDHGANISDFLETLSEERDINVEEFLNHEENNGGTEGGDSED